MKRAQIHDFSSEPSMTGESQQPEVLSYALYPPRDSMLNGGPAIEKVSRSPISKGSFFK